MLVVVLGVLSGRNTRTKRSREKIVAGMKLLVKKKNKVDRN